MAEWGDLPVELLSIILSNLPKREQLKLLRLCKQLREELLNNTLLFSFPNQTPRYRRDLTHFFLFGQVLLGQKQDETWQTCWFFNSTLKLADRHELFSSCVGSRACRLYRAKTLAGTGEEGYDGDGSLAIDAKLTNPWSVHVRSDGCVLIATKIFPYQIGPSRTLIREVTPSGIIRTIAGCILHDPTKIYSATPVEGQLALESEFGSIEGLTTDLQGRVLFSHSDQVWRINHDGTLYRLIGNAVSMMALVDDGKPARESNLCSPLALCSTHDGRVLVVSRMGEVVSVLGTDGILRTLAGTGIKGCNFGEDHLAKSSQLNNPQGVCESADGRVFIADTWNHRICQVNTDGAMTVMFGRTNESGYSGDGELATLASLNCPQTVCLDPDERILITDGCNHCVRMIDDEGKIHTIAGTPIKENVRPQEEMAKVIDREIRQGIPALEVRLQFGGIHAGSDGRLFLADYFGHRVFVLESWFDVHQSFPSTKEIH